MRIAPAKKKKLFLSIAVLLVLTLTVLGIWYPGGLTNLPVVREVKVRWYIMRLNHDDPRIQWYAISALGEMGPKAKLAVPDLHEMLKSKDFIGGNSDPSLRALAATALGQIFSDSDFPDPSIRQTLETSLREALQDDNSWVRSSARKALDQIIPGGQTIEPALTLHAGGVGNVAFSPDGKWLAAGSGKGLDIRDDTTTVWDAVTGEETLTLGHAGGVAFSPDGRWLVTGNGTSTARLWDLKAENPDAGSRELKGDTYSSWSVAISPDGRWLVTGNSDNTARLWDLKSENPAAGCREIKSEVKGHTLSCINCVAISPDGRWLVTGNWTKKARLWDLKSKNPSAGSRALIGHIRAIICMAISPDGRWLATGSLGKTARLWDLKSENPAAGPLELKDHTKAIHCVAISPDGRWLATGSDDGTVRLWDLKSENPAAESREIKGYAGHIRWVGFSPDGKWLAAPSGAKVRMWEVETGLEMQSFVTGSFTVVQPRRVGRPGHASSPICSVAFSPDGKRLASVSWDKTVNVWDIRPTRATGRSR